MGQGMDWILKKKSFFGFFLMNLKIRERQVSFNWVMNP